MSSLSTSMRPLSQLAIHDFLRKLASSDPAPGGGSAAALVGALAASLVTMVGALTLGRKGFEEAHESLELLIEQGEQIAESLTVAVDRDAAAYEEVMAAYGLPKGDEAQKQERSVAIQAAMRHAAEVPLEAAEECLATAELAAIALARGNPNASSDAAVGMLCALTGLEGAILNVATNLDSIKDADYVAHQKQELERLLNRSVELRAGVWDAVRQRIASLP